MTLVIGGLFDRAPREGAGTVRGQRVAGLTFAAGTFTVDTTEDWTLDGDAPSGFGLDDMGVLTDVLLTVPVDDLRDDQLGYMFVASDGTDEAVIMKPLGDRANAVTSLGGAELTLSYSGGYLVSITNMVTTTDDITVECFVANV